MSENTLLIATAIVGGIIIFALAVYAGKLLMQVKQQRIANEKIILERQRKLVAHDNKVYDSVIIIVRAMKEAQCDVSEGSWRLSVLLDSLKLSESLTGQFPAIFELYESIKHLSILDKRKELPKQQRMQQDVERMKIEAKLTDDIMAELDALYQFANQQKTQLND